MSTRHTYYVTQSGIFVCANELVNDYYDRVGLSVPNNDEVEMEAVCIYVTGLVDNEMLTKGRCIYLVSPKGLTEASHQLLSSSFQLTYFGTTAGVHSANGIKGNGIDFAALTGFVPTLNGLDSTNFSTHSRTRSSGQTQGINYGASSGKGLQAHLISRTITDKVRFNYFIGAGEEFDNTDGAGSYTYSSVDGNNDELYFKDGVLLGKTTGNVPLDRVEMALWATTDVPTPWSDQEQNYFDWFEFLTPEQVAIKNTLEFNYQNTVIPGGRIP